MGLMGRYTMIYAKVWSDAWFEELQPDAKLLWLFLLAHPNISRCGSIEFSVKLAHAHTGLDVETIKTILTKFISDHKIVCEAGHVWIRNFIPYQRYNANGLIGAKNEAVALAPKCPQISKLAVAVCEDPSEAFRMLPNDSEPSHSYPYPNPHPNPYPDDASQTERLILAEMSEWKGMKNLDYSKSLKYLRKLSLEFTTLDLLDIAKTATLWLDKHPRLEGSHLRFRNFCKTATNGSFPQSNNGHHDLGIVEMDKAAVK